MIRKLSRAALIIAIFTACGIEDVTRSIGDNTVGDYVQMDTQACKNTIAGTETNPNMTEQAKQNRIDDLNCVINEFETLDYVYDYSLTGEDGYAEWQNVEYDAWNNCGQGVPLG